MPGAADDQRRAFNQRARRTGKTLDTVLPDAENGKPPVHAIILDDACAC